MKPIVYIDTLFLINLIFNMLIYFLSAYLLRKDTSPLRIFGVAALGALYGALMFFPKLGIFYTGAFKVLFTVLSAKLLFWSKGVKSLIKESLMCFFVSIGFSGAISACLFLSGASLPLGMVVSGGVVYLDVDPLILLAGVVISLFVMIFFSSSVKENFKKDGIINEFTVTAGGKTFGVKALSDTGCDLFDPTGKFPALIVEKNALPEIENVERVELFFSGITGENERIKGFLPDTVSDGKKNFYKAVILEGRPCLDKKGRFNAVVNPEIFSITNSEGGI